MKSLKETNTILSPDVLYNIFTKSAILALPGCIFSGKTGYVEVFFTNSTVAQNLSITVPQCRLKREVVQLNTSISGNTQTVNLGFRIPSLSPNSNYAARYVFGTALFGFVNFTTRNNDTSPSETFARSGGMVVITVILSVAMFLLIVMLIVALVVKGGAKK
uniref:Uroplakin-2 n=1 Tax=Leptobrachium leishanense TaxID=445787 RepID=A0A8C5Q0A0_9ANUR